MNARDYRKHLYEHRSHPLGAKGFSEASDSGSIYFSIIGFVAFEYFLQLKLEKLPSGIAFPFGFLFFWAFYYTYYQPGALEKTLSSERKWDLTGIPMTIMSSCIWFVKIVCVELVEKILSSLFYSPPQKPVKPQKPQMKNFDENKFSSSVSEPVMLLPRELVNALGVLGIPQARDWLTIQKRYRELAKKYHPDLNPDLTQAGNRFMLYDAAYRKLELAKDRYFKSVKTR